MEILLLGVGMQGRAALYDLVMSDKVTGIVAADRDLASLKEYVSHNGFEGRVRCEVLDAADRESINRLMAQRTGVVVDLLPASFAGAVAASALEHGVHLVNTVYPGDEIQALADEARERGVTFLPEFGLDPGIDLVLLGEALRGFDSVESLLSYGAGLPEFDAADNPLRYKVSWTFEGVLKAYCRAGRILRDGQVVVIQAGELFAPEHIHGKAIEPLGRLEAFPNGDAMRYVDQIGLDLTGLRNVGRYALRWPGHCAFWKTMVDLHLLDDEPVMVTGLAVDRKRFLAAVIEPQIQYAPDERDLALVRVEVTGRRNGHRESVAYQVLDRRDLDTGLTAMSRTVGFTASIGAQMIASGVISQRGLLSPLTDIPYGELARELGKRGIQIDTWILPQPG